MKAVHVAAMLVHVGLCGGMARQAAWLSSGGAESERVCKIVERVLEKRKPEVRVDADDVCAVLSLVERPGVLESGKRAVFMRTLAEAALCSYDFRREIAERRDAPGVREFVLQMLRECADMQDVDVRVEDGTATLCPRNWRPRTRYGLADAVEAVSSVRVVAEAMKRIDLDDACPVVWFMDVTEIRRLDVSGCELDEEVLRSIGVLRSVRSLRMQGCRMAKGGLEHLSRELVRDLEELDVSKNKLDRRDVTRIGKMRSMEVLDVSGCDVEKGSLSKMVEQMESLRELRALGNRVSECDLKGVGEKQGLRVLEIGVCYVAEGSLCVLGELKELEELSVSCTRVGRRDMEGIAEMRCLERLDVRSREMEQGSFEGIHELERLRRLSIACGELGAADLRGIGRTGVLSLRMCGVVCGSLRYLWERRDGSEENIEMTSVAEGRRDLQSLRELDLSDNRLDRGDMYEVGKMGRLEKLNIRYCNVEAGSMHSLRGLAGLRELRMYRNNVSREDLSELGQMRSLRVLDIGDCKIKTGSMKYLRGVKVQKRLHSFQGGMFGKLWMRWASREHLESRFDVEDGARTGGTLRRSQTSEASLGSGEWSELEVLCVSENELSEEDLVEIGEMRNLTKLHMDYCKAKPGSMRPLKKLARLKELSAAEFPAHESWENKSIMEELRQRGVDVRGG